uniref:Pol polyprotein n=1 Tax=Oryza sativa subsp. japonica TaxID=39947 RepID=Q8S6X2_ORYSJ|nr:putative pol polyprotein [Oryza sativa Japonica Group]
MGGNTAMFNHMPPMQFNQGWGGPRRPALSSRNEVGESSSNKSEAGTSSSQSVGLTRPSGRSDRRSTAGPTGPSGRSDRRSNVGLTGASGQSDRWSKSEPKPRWMPKDLTVLTTKFGNRRIGDGDESKRNPRKKLFRKQSKNRLRAGSAEFESDKVGRLSRYRQYDIFGQKSVAKTYGILEFVRDKSRVRHEHILIKSTGTLTHIKASFWTCTGVKQIPQASCFSHQQTATQKRRLQRLWAQELREREAEEQRDTRFNELRPPPTKMWRYESSPKEEMDVNMVCMLPMEFCAMDKDEVAQFSLGPKNAVFEKPDESNRHMKPLYLKGHIDGKPVSRMLVDRGAAVNLMPYSLFKRLGRGDDELKKTNMILNGFNGEPTEAKGIFSVELTMGNKTLPTTFFIVDVQGSYNVILGRCWIHANCCVPSTLHQCLIQWDGDDVEIVQADTSTEVAMADAIFEWRHWNIQCLSGMDLSSYDFFSISNGKFVPISVKPAGLARLGHITLCNE